MPDIKDLLIPAVAVVGLVGVVAGFLLTRGPKILLDKKRKRVQVLDVLQLTHDTKRIRLSTGGKNSRLGLPCGKHIQLFCPNPSTCISSGKWNGKDDMDRGIPEIKRSYTPTEDGLGYTDLVVKVYRPGKVQMPDGKEVTWEDGGKMSLFLDGLKAGDHLDINGPIGLVEYFGKGSFKVPGGTKEVQHCGMMAGGTGITPMLQIVAAALADASDTTKFSLIYANKTEDDILCKDLLDQHVQASNGRFKVHYTLDFPPNGWQGKTGFITADMIKECLPPPSQKPLMLMCGPPPMVEFACKKNLEALEYPKGTYHSF